MRRIGVFLPATALLLAALVLLAACTPKGDAASAQSAPPAASTPDKASTSSPTSVLAGPLRALATDGAAQENVAGSVELFAFRGTRHHDRIILYNDFATKTQYPLCAIAGCPHTDEYCNAYLPDDPDWLVLAGDAVLVQRDFAGGYTNANFSTSTTTIERIELDGTGRRMLLETERDLVVEEAVATDDAALFFPLYNPSDKPVQAGELTLAAYESALVRFDIETGGLSTIYSEEGWHYRGVYDENTLLFTVSGGLGYERDMALYDVETGETRVLAKLPEDYTDDPGLLYDGALYIVVSRPGRKKDEPLHLVAYQPVEEKYLFDIDVLPNTTIQRAVDGYLVCTVWNHLPSGYNGIYPKEGALNTWRYFDAKTGAEAAAPPTVTATEPRILSPGEPDSPTEDTFVVTLCGTDENGDYIVKSGAVRQDYIAPGRARPTFTNQDTYGTIAKADYWAGAADIQEIAPWRYPEGTQPRLSVTPEQQRLLAFGAVLAQRNDFGFSKSDILPPRANRAEKGYLAFSLYEWWGIMDRPSALDSLDGLLMVGHRTQTNNYAGLDLILDMLRHYDSLTPEEQDALATHKAGLDSLYGYLTSPDYYEEDHYTMAELEAIDTLSAWDYDRLVTVARWCYSLGYITEEEMYAYAQQAADLAVADYDGWRDYCAAVIIGRTLWLGQDTPTDDDLALVNQLLFWESVYDEVDFAL